MNKAWMHFKTITYHKYLVARGCFQVGLYKQGLLHDMSRETEAPIMRKGKPSAIPVPGCTTKDATSTIMSTGSITA